jgi:protein required for attachment to host cells
MAYSEWSPFYKNTDADEPVVRLRKAWVVMVDGDCVVVRERVVQVSSMLSLFAHDEDRLSVKQAAHYLEKAQAEGKFSTLMLVGEADDLRHFRAQLPQAVDKRVAAEVQRPNRNSEFLDQRIQEMCA